MAMKLIADLSREMLVLSMLVKVVDGIDDKEDHAFLERLLVVYPLLGLGVPIQEAIKVPSSQP